MYELALFSGAGGGILGGILCGHTCIGAVEIEEYPRKVLLARQRDGFLPKFPIWDDVCTFRHDNDQCRDYIDFLRTIKDELVISGGFPCQDISCAGKGAGLDGSRSGLWSEFARIIGEIRPAVVFVENSPMLAVRGGTRVVADLAKMGYYSRWGVVGARDAGSYHRRDRFWILAYNSSVIGFSENESFNSNVSKTIIRCPEKSTWNLAGTAGLGTKERLVETGISRTNDGLANWMVRLKAIGNGQVPAVVELAWNILGGK